MAKKSAAKNAQFWNKLKEMDEDDLEMMIDANNECLSVVPLGKNRSALLYLLFDDDYVQTVSVIFEVEDFNPKKAKLLLVTEEWLMSLAVAPNGDLVALQATTTAWTFSGGAWKTENLAGKSFRSIDAANGGPIAYGDEGSCLQLQGGKWVSLKCPMKEIIQGIASEKTQGLVVCGNFGSLFQLKDGNWKQIKIDEEISLSACEITSSGVIYAGGSGKYLEIKEGKVTEIDGPDCEIFCVKAINGKVYWVTEAGSFMLEKGELKPSDIALGMTATTDEKYVYADGMGAIRVGLDGENAIELVLTYDDGFYLEVAPEDDGEDDDEDE